MKHILLILLAAAMYMNADGAVDIIPASSSAWAENGTYSVKNNIITLKADDGEVHTLTLESGKLITDNLFYRPLTLTRKN